MCNGKNLGGFVFTFYRLWYVIITWHREDQEVPATAKENLQVFDSFSNCPGPRNRKNNSSFWLDKTKHEQLHFLFFETKPNNVSFGHNLAPWKSFDTISEQDDSYSSPASFPPGPREVREKSEFLLKAVILNIWIHEHLHNLLQIFDSRCLKIIFLGDHVRWICFWGPKAPNPSPQRRTSRTM